MHVHCTCEIWYWLSEVSPLLFELIEVFIFRDLPSVWLLVVALMTILGSINMRTIMNEEPWRCYTTLQMVVCMHTPTHIYTQSPSQQPPPHTHTHTPTPTLSTAQVSWRRTAATCWAPEDCQSDNQHPSQAVYTQNSRRVLHNAKWLAISQRYTEIMWYSDSHVGRSQGNKVHRQQRLKVLKEVRGHVYVQ